MSLIKSGKVQVGQSGTSTENFHFRNLLDGLLRVCRGNAEEVAPTEVMVVNADDSVSFPGGYTGSADDEKRRCTAWVNFNGTGTVAIRDSFNVSSVTDLGTGYYAVNFAVAMSNANYAVAHAVGITASGNVTSYGAPRGAAPTVNSIHVLTGNFVSVSDAEYVSVTIFGGV